MIIKKNITDSDKKKLSEAKIDPKTQIDDCFDYSKVIVKKPWGYEYLIYQNDLVAVWILFIKKGFQTSMHCHPLKKTSLVILSGEAVCSTLSDEHKLTPGQGLLIDKSVFHSTRSVSDEGIFLMEIETPVNKRDLIRLRDKYGRTGKGYETIDDMSFNIQNYNYISLIDQDVYYNVKKKFGKCSISLKKFNNYNDFKENFKVEGWDAISILKGQILNEKNNVLLDVGDTLSFKEIKSCKNIKIKDEIEIVIIKRMDHMIKLSDFIASFFEKNKINNVFAVPGSNNLHLIDSLGKNNEINCIFTQTEQTATMAAEGYAKLTGNLGVSIISSGFCGTNALTGVADSWVDSTPLMIISGQTESPYEDFHLSINNLAIRQLGIQELNITNVVKTITKYSAIVLDPHIIKYHLEKALFFAKNGRPGPVWIDIPINILSMNIDEEELKSFDVSGITTSIIQDSTSEKVSKLISLLEKSRRPVLLAGNGIRLSKAENQFIELIKLLGIPVLTSRRGADLLSNDHPLFYGRPGTYGQRSANFIIQNSDLVLSIGSRLSLPQLGRNYNDFARQAKKIVVDIDNNELTKKTISPEISINADAKEFINEIIKQLKNKNLKLDIPNWIKKCEDYKTRFSREKEKINIDGTNVNAYNLIDTLSEELKENDIITVDGLSTTIFMMQTFKFKSDQRLISSTGLENTSFSLPGSIGVSVGNGKKRVICLCENTGFLKNTQELETIAEYKLPIKIFVLNSRRYLYLRKSQEKYFGKRFTGSEYDDKKSSPDIIKLGNVYGFKTFEINKNQEIKDVVRDVLSDNKPTICVINIDKDQEIIPRVLFTVKPDGKWIPKPLEDMYPFLERKELKDNMIIGALEED